MHANCVEIVRCGGKELSRKRTCRGNVPSRKSTFGEKYVSRKTTAPITVNPDKPSIKQGIRLDSKF